MTDPNAVLPRSALHSLPVARKLAVIPIEGFDIDRVFASMRGRPESLAAQALRTIVLEQIGVLTEKESLRNDRPTHRPRTPG